MLNTSQIHIRDPYVLVWNGRYYLYGTRGATCWGAADGFDVYVSDDLLTWEEPVECFHNDGGFWATHNYWAPEVHVWKGRFYMLASFKAEGVCRCTCSLAADSPLGPFRPWSDGGLTPRDWECLDGTLAVSRAGEPYLVFCHEWVQIGDGTVCSVPLTGDLRAASGEPRTLFRASEAKPWVRSVHHKRTGIDGYVTDGPFMWRRGNGDALLLWSSFSDEGYAQALAASDGDIDGDFKPLPEPLFRKDGGHGMLFRALDGRLMLALHAPNDQPNERPIFIDVTDRPELQ